MAVIKQRLLRKNSEGLYDVLHLETGSEQVVRPNGNTIEQDLTDYLPSVKITPETLAAKQDKLEGTEGQVVGFDASGNAVPQGTESLRGPAGKDGTNGKDGKSAYQYAVDGGYTGTEAEFKSLLGNFFNPKITHTSVQIIRFGIGSIKDVSKFPSEGSQYGFNTDNPPYMSNSCVLTSYGPSTIAAGRFEIAGQKFNISGMDPENAIGYSMYIKFQIPGINFNNLSVIKGIGVGTVNIGPSCSISGDIHSDGNSRFVWAGAVPNLNTDLFKSNGLYLRIGFWILV